MKPAPVPFVTLDDPRYGDVVQVAPLVRRVVANNPSKFTYLGTGTYLVGEGDHVAVIGTNRKLLVFPLAEVPDLARGSGVTLQKHRDSKLADAKVFRLADGLTWRLGEKTRTEAARDWIGSRGQVGRMPPNGFPKTGRFS